MRFLLILFVVVPLLELFVLIQVGQLIGALPTVGLVILTAIVGIALLRRQGYSALASAREKMAQGQIPAEEMVSGIFLAVGGVLLLTPGFITDFFGLCCLTPGVRRGLLVWATRHLFPGGVVTVHQHGSADANRVIEGEYERDKRNAPDR